MSAWKNKRVRNRERLGPIGRSAIVIDVERLESRLLLSSISGGLLTAFGASSSGQGSSVEPPPPLFPGGWMPPHGWVNPKPRGATWVYSAGATGGQVNSVASDAHVLDWPAVDMTAAIDQAIQSPNFGDPAPFAPPLQVPTTVNQPGPAPLLGTAASVDLQAADPLPDAAAMTVGDSVSGSRPINIYRVPIDPGTVAVRIMLRSTTFNASTGPQMALMDPTGKVIGEWRDLGGGDPLDVTFTSTVNQLPPVVYIGVWTTSTSIPQASAPAENLAGLGSDSYVLSVDKQVAPSASSLPPGQYETSIVQPIGGSPTSLNLSNSSSSSDSATQGKWKLPPQAISSAPSSFSDQSGVTFGQGGGVGGSATGPLPQFFAGPAAGILGAENLIRNLDPETISQGLVEAEAFDPAAAPFASALVQNTSGYLGDESGDGTASERSTSVPDAARSTLGFAGSPDRFGAGGFDGDRFDHALASLSYHMMELDRIASLNASIAAGGDPEAGGGAANRPERGADLRSTLAVVTDSEGSSEAFKSNQRAIPKAVGVATALGVLLYLPDLALKLRGGSREIPPRKKGERKPKA